MRGFERGRRANRLLARTGTEPTVFDRVPRLGIVEAASRPQHPGRPKVGLALGGGGARGIAHVGVLTALEEARIPIDFLAGTSMGGIVAAPYAVGYSARQIADEAIRLGSINNILKFVDWLPTNKGLLQARLCPFGRHEMSEIWVWFWHIQVE